MGWMIRSSVAPFLSLEVSALFYLTRACLSSPTQATRQEMFVLLAQGLIALVVCQFLHDLVFNILHKFLKYSEQLLRGASEPSLLRATAHTLSGPCDVLQGNSFSLVLRVELSPERRPSVTDLGDGQGTWCQVPTWLEHGGFAGGRRFRLCIFSGIF